MTDRRADVLAERRSEMMDTIYSAALEQFSLYGLRGTSTQDIAERAGMSKQQLHYYIVSKEALYESIVRRTVEHWTRIGLHADGETIGSPAVAISSLIRRKLEFALDFPQVSRFFASEISSGGHVIRGIWSQNLDQMKASIETLTEWVRTKQIRKIDPVYFLFHIWALTQHYADYEAQVRFFAGYSDTQPLDREKICSEITSLVLRGVGIDMPNSARRVAAASRKSRLNAPRALA